jgi:hypothetical protein
MSQNPEWIVNHTNSIPEGIRKRSLNISWVENNRIAREKVYTSDTWLQNVTNANIKKGQDKVLQEKLVIIRQTSEYKEKHIAACQSIDRRKKLSAAHLGIPLEQWLEFAKKGDYCDAWTDPVLKVHKRVRARYNDRCIICGKTYEQNGHKHMHVHHVYKNKDACCAGERASWLFATLCDICHGKYGKKENDIIKIREIIALEYGNKSILSLEEYNKLYPPGSEGDKKWGSSNGS